MTTKTKVILGIGAALALLIVIVGTVFVSGLAGAFYYTYKKLDDPELKAKSAKAKAAGTEFGKTTDQQGCMTKAFTLTPTTDSFDVSNQDFAKACINSSTPTPNFCDGVPFVFDRAWFTEQCKMEGQNNEACMSAFIAKRNVCRMDSKN